MSNLATLIPLFKRDFIRVRREFLGRLVDCAALLFCLLVVFGYLMSSYGLDTDYGSFILVSSVASFGFFGTVNKVFNLITDIAGDRTISYTLTLPLPSWLVFVYIGFFWALESAITSFLIFPIGKLILFNSFDLSKISYFKLIPIFISMNLFYGFFSLWIASMLRNLADVGKLWVRVINPLIMFGANYYSWDAAFQAAPTIALIELLNPVTYIMEGMRNATLGQSHSLSFPVCLLVIWAFTFVCAWNGTHRLQKQLDCVR